MTMPVTDARVRKTKRRLRDALARLVHEKSYDTIVVRDILDRADIGRTAFYAHFPNKDALLASGIDQILRATPPRDPRSDVGPFGKAVWFSFPFFQYVSQCHHSSMLKMGRQDRSIVHRHLRHALIDQVGDDVRAIASSLKNGGPGVPVDLLVAHIVETFMLVLTWWIESRSALSAREVDDLFLDLVCPALAARLKV